jgi:large subunit ribosomal protein L3
MIHGLLGKKLGMTQIFDETGQVVPVSVLKVGPCVVTQVRTQEKDGYEAVQLGFEDYKKLNSPERGHRRAAGSSSRYLREFKASDASEYTVGQVLDCTLFSVGDSVDVTGMSKGKGFQGVVKRHHFKGGRATHGSMFHRAPGSIGASSFPSRVVKGMRAAGRMGGKRITIHNLKVLRVDPENHLLIVEGGIPGSPTSYVIIRKAVTMKKLKVAQVEKPKKGKK